MPDKDKYVTAIVAAKALGLAGEKAFVLFAAEHHNGITTLTYDAGETLYSITSVLQASAYELNAPMISTRTLAQRVGLSRQRVLEYVHTQRLRPSAHRGAHRALLFTATEADRFADMLLRV